MFKFKFFNNMSSRAAGNLCTGRHSDMYLSVVMMLEEILGSLSYVDTTDESNICISVIDKTKKNEGFSMTAMLLNGSVSLIVQTAQCKGTTVTDKDTCWYVESSKYNVDVRSCSYLDAMEALNSITVKIDTVA